MRCRALHARIPHFQEFTDMHLNDLKQKTPAELVAMAEELGVEGASTLRSGVESPFSFRADKGTR